jgi:hypothetical protein
MTGDLFGASMRTVYMGWSSCLLGSRGCPTASSQTVPMNGCFVPILSLLTIDQRLGPTVVHHVFRRSWTNPEESTPTLNGVSR